MRTLFRIEWKDHLLELGRRTCVMGILNVTPDSFSDGGHFFDHGMALAHCEEMVEQGADIIDIGGESTRPFAESVDAEEETRRVVPVIEKLAPRIKVPISIDTFKSTVARRAIDAGASIINDITALDGDPDMGAVAAHYDVPLILMHMKGTPRTMQIEPVYENLMGEICTFLEHALQRARAAGISDSKLIVDPGIGFGKNLSHNLELIARLHEFNGLGVPILIGSSRKAFIRKILTQKRNMEMSPDRPEVEIGSQAVVAASILNGAHMVRVHNVANTRSTADIIDEILAQQA